MYKVLKGIANDKTGERYQPGDTVDLKDWTKKEINWLIGRGAIVATTRKPRKKAKDA